MRCDEAKALQAVRQLDRRRLQEAASWQLGSVAVRRFRAQANDEAQAQSSAARRARAAHLPGRQANDEAQTQ